jgi:acetyl coenzyme A synthetase (ADP forming)-like protein
MAATVTNPSASAKPERRFPDVDHRSLVPLLQPRSVAVIGASRTASAIGRRVLDALIDAGFAGHIYPVNPHANEIAGLPCFRSVRELPRGIDLAVVAVPADVLLRTIEDCGAAGVQSLVVITAGLGETGEAGRALERTIVDRVRSYGMRMVGPNCMGLLNTRLHLNASFSPIVPPIGSVALSSQSGALGLAILEQARHRHIGLSTFVSVGNKADLSSNDLLEYWEHDPETSVIMLYLESFGNPRKFSQIARRIGRHKPIVAVKSGRTGAGIRAASSHTAALAASDAVVDELCRASGVIRANTIDEMFDVAACLAAQPLPSGRRVAVVTNAGGPGILAVDACEGAGLSVVEFSATTRRRLADFLPSAASLSNPVDMVASASGDAYRQAIAVALDAEETDSLIVIYTPVDPSQSGHILDGITAGIADARAAGRKKPVLACLLASVTGQPLMVGQEQIPVFTFPENAARALARVATYAEWRHTTPGGLWTFGDVATPAARAVCAGAAAARGETWLTPEELSRVFQAYGLPVVTGVPACSAEEAANLAGLMEYPVVAKISAPNLLHKSEINGVRTSLRSAGDVRRAATDLLAIARANGLAGASILVQPMLDGVETMIGAIHDPLFGPLVGFGLGGTDVEIEQDVHFRPTPLTDQDAADLIKESRARIRFAGYRGRPPADVEAVSELLLRVSQMAEEIPELRELDLNPVIVLPKGRKCMIVDARMKVGR